MNTIGVLFTIAVFLTVHTCIMRMCKEAVKPKPKPTIPRSKWL